MAKPVPQSAADAQSELLARVRVHGAVPRHIAIIMDGNGRWARERHMPRPFGHRSGMKAVRDVVEGCLDAGVEWLSLFAFSQENWQRPPAEIDALMALLEEYVAKEAEDLRHRGVSVRMLGDQTLANRLSIVGSDRARAFSWRDSAERVWQLHADL